MYQEQEDVYYYITVMNENYAHPAMPPGAEHGHIEGDVPVSRKQARKNSGLRVQLLGSRHHFARGYRGAQNCWKQDYGVAADIWSVTSFNELRREALRRTRWNMLHPDETPRPTYVGKLPQGPEGARSSRLPTI